MYRFSIFYPGTRVIRREILDLVGLFWDLPINPTIDDLVFLTQHWVKANQKAGSSLQRYDSAPFPGFAAYDSAMLVEKFAQIGLVDEVADVEGHFDYAIIPGATVLPQRRRIALLDKLVRRGVGVGQVVLLGGRPLSPKVDTLEKLMQAQDGVLPIRKDWQPPTALTGTETDLMGHVWSQAELSPGLRNLTPTYVHVVPPEGGRVSAKLQVPQWLSEHKPEPGRVLIVTVQPHLFHGYSFGALLPGFSVEVAAASALTGLHTPDYLADGLGTVIHEEQKFLANVGR